MPLATTSELFLREPLRTLRRNVMRSSLSALGVTIGIAAVVCVIAVGDSGTRHAEEQLFALGDNLVWIESGSRNVAGVRTGTHGDMSLTVEDAEAIQSQIPRIKAVSPQVDGGVGVMNGNKNWRTQYRGVSASFLHVRRWTIAQGSAFTDAQVEQASSVVLIGETIRQQLFAEESDGDPVGAVIRLNGGLYTVIGVLGAKGQAPNGRDQDDTLLMPYTTALQRLRGGGSHWLDDILCSAATADDVLPAIDQVSALLRERHVIQSGPTGEPDDDFNIRRPDESIKAQIEASQTLSDMLTGVASISLLIGGIGIMNVMLVSVAQRTREIGLRLAVGATEMNVLTQFLGEAILLCSFGGVAGSGLGVVGAYALGKSLGWPVNVPPQVFVVAPGVALVVGVISGLYPAWKAARLDPIAGLRSE